MIRGGAFKVEPWAVREVKPNMESLGQCESIFALSNGHIGWRANLDEGDPHVILGSYLNAVFEEAPLPHAEAAYGYPEAGQTIINVTNGQVIRLIVNDEPLDIRYGNLISHERVLDFKAGVLRRTAEWESPAHRTIRVRSTRLVSLVHRALAAIEYEVEPVDGPAEIVLESELVANEPAGGIDASDPRTAPVMESPLAAEFSSHRGQRAILVHTTKRSKLRIAAGMDHVIEAPRGARVTVENGDDLARLTVTARLKRGERLRVAKFVAYAWSSLRQGPALRSQVEGALAAALGHGWKGLAGAQQRRLKEYWSGCDVEINGDPELQQAIRFALFHVIQSTARAEQRAIPAKGLTGPGYSGHTFWDTETFVLQALTYTAPTAAADALSWRHQILDLARARAHDLGWKGAAFPWRTIRGEECSGYWPASTAALHVNADIADAVLRYVSATGDLRFEETVGAELLVETARLWRSVGHYERSGSFRIDGVTGPDEYSALMDNNLYTNLMAQRNLRGAADAATRNLSVARRLRVTNAEVKAWRKAADNVYIPHDQELQVHKQASQFTDHERWDFGRTRPDQYPLFLHFPYFDLYRKQVIKQADLVLAMHLRGDAFTAEEKARNFAYYEELTVRDSSLSASTQSVIAAEVGHVQLAYDYLGEAALIDLDDLEHNVRDGLHMGSLAGAWLAVVAGLGGMRHHGGSLSFAPRLPPGIQQLTFRMTFLGRLIRVRIDRQRATYTLVHGRALTLAHHGQELDLKPRRPIARSIPKITPPDEPKQPPGRAPARRLSPPHPVGRLPPAPKARGPQRTRGRVGSRLT